MPKADSVHSTPPTDTPIDTTRRGFLGGTAAALAAGTAVNVAALATMRPATAASDPILAAIEAHKAATAARDVVLQRFSAFEAALHANERLRYEDRNPEETRQGRALDDAVVRAYDAENEAALAMLHTSVTTFAGLMALLAHVQRFDDETHGEGWPNHLVDDNTQGERSWHYFMTTNLIRDLPAIMGRAV